MLIYLILNFIRRYIMAHINDLSHSTGIPTPHIGCGDRAEIAETVLLPGDPLRAKFIAENFFENVKQFNSVRNMFGYTGEYKGKRVSVMGTGMGCASMGIYSYELMNFYGVKNLIRVGTAGALSKKLKVKDLVFGMGACTTSNYVKLFGLPGDFAPICSYELLSKGVKAAEEKGFRYHVGNVLSSDMFYGYDLPSANTWSEMGVLAVEMEAAALYSNAAKAGANALALLTISDTDDEVTTAEERQTCFTNMMEVALEIA